MVRKTFLYDGTGPRRSRLYRVEDHVPLPSDTTPPTDPETGQPAAQEPPAGDPPPPAVEEPAGNASTEEWAEFAASLGVEVPEDTGREAIKDLIAEAVEGVPADPDAVTPAEGLEEVEGSGSASDDSAAADEAHDTGDDPFAAAAATLK